MGITQTYGRKAPRRQPPPPPEPEPEDPVTTTAVVVGQEATRIGVRDTRSQVTIHNPGTEPIWLGGRSVSALTSLPVQPGGYASLDVPAEVVLYACTTSPEPIEVRVLEVA